MLSILTTSASSSGGSVKRQSGAGPRGDGHCGQDALWSLFTDSAMWPWMTELAPGQGSPQLDGGSDNTCLWPNAVAEATPPLLVLLTEENATIYLLLAWQSDRRATHLARSSVLSTPPTGRRFLGSGYLEVGPRAAEAQRTEFVLRLSHLVCAINRENIWAKQLTATEPNLIFRGQDNGKRQHIMAPNAWFYFTFKNRKQNHLMVNTEVADLASSPTLWTPVSTPMPGTSQTPSQVAHDGAGDSHSCRDLQCSHYKWKCPPVS